MTNNASCLLICFSVILVVSASAQTSKPIYQTAHYSVYPDRVVEGTHTAKALSSTELVSNYPISTDTPEGKRQWTLQDNIADYPQFHSGTTLFDAIYNLSLSELKRDISKENEFDAGALWPGVWTRDVSYSILLSLAILDPKRAEATLLRKVNRDRIIQDTGTGGSWPVSTDRVCWSLAAWEIYLVTGDKRWLKKSSKIIEDTIDDDEAVVIDPVSGLAHGESSFLDWREQTYPLWMEPVDIYESENLGTNAVYYRTYRVLAAMDQELGVPSRDWDAKAERIRASLNSHLWMKDKGLYGQYLYGRVWQTLSPRSEALGEALCILFDIPSAANQEAILRSQPLMPFGIPTVYPETPNIVPYHNRSVWPFVQAYWNWAAAKRGDETAVLYGLASLCRSTALFLTNKENFVADTGSPVGTAVNSDRQLWSVAGSLSMVYRIFFGMEFATDGLHLHPVIPESLAGTRSLTNFHYRQAVLSLTVNGHGNQVRRITIDGRPAPIIPSTLSGSHTVVIELADRASRPRRLNLVEALTAVDTPSPKLDGHTLSWAPVESAKAYQVYRNGAYVTSTSKTSFSAANGAGLTQYQIAALGSSPRTTSYLSAPVITSNDSLLIPVANPKAINSASFVTLEQTGVTGLSLDQISKSGKYAISVRFANGSGPINTNNMCAVRTLFIDDKQIGPIVMPQRGNEKWADWGFSNSQEIQLTDSPHKIELRLLPEDLNMNGKVNKVMVISILLAPLSINPPPAVATQ